MSHPSGILEPMLLPSVCPVCGSAGPVPCGPCRAALRPAPELPPPPGLSACLALMAYEGTGREIVARLKYRNARGTVPWLAGEMARLARDAGVSEAGVVAWVPTTAARRRRRGFDQGRLLATAVARRLGLPCRALLRRRPGPAQTGRSRPERLLGPDFEVARSKLLPGRLLLVDDVVTTGATLAAAAKVLRRAGADDVRALVAARRR